MQNIKGGQKREYNKPKKWSGIGYKHKGKRKIVRKISAHCAQYVKIHEKRQVMLIQKPTRNV